MSSVLDELDGVCLVEGLGPELGQGAHHHPGLQVLLGQTDIKMFLGRSMG